MANEIAPSSVRGVNRIRVYALVDIESLPDGNKV